MTVTVLNYNRFYFSASSSFSLVFVSIEKKYHTLKTLFNHISENLEVRQLFSMFGNVVKHYLSYILYTRLKKFLRSKNQTFSAVCHHQGFNPDDGKQPKTFGFYFLKTFLALYIEYILISEHYGHDLSCSRIYFLVHKIGSSYSFLLLVCVFDAPTPSQFKSHETFIYHEYCLFIVPLFSKGIEISRARITKRNQYKTKKDICTSEQNKFI